MDTEGDAIHALEHYVREASIETIWPLRSGGGHPEKMTLVLSGGVGVVAKPANDQRTSVQARREVAARVLAVELGLDALVPVTVLRSMPRNAEADAETEGSAQVLWPRFKTALENALNAGTCPGGSDVSWPIAVFDSLAANEDRHMGNWGVIDPVSGQKRVVLIDHGLAFATSSAGEFAGHHRGEEIPDALLLRVEEFVHSRRNSALHDVLDEVEATAVFERARVMLKTRQLDVR
ncbi:MAG TPA: hypothetical protein VGY76_14210 [Solirubrobacteraceae bacterium]|nr:hypothetical protein [Solirubrobacteraceae bacterium]